MSTISIPYKSSRKWARIGRPDLEMVKGAISSSSVSEKSSPESGSYSSGGDRASATATAKRQSSTNEIKISKIGTLSGNLYEYSKTFNTI